MPRSQFADFRGPLLPPYCSKERPERSFSECNCLPGRSLRGRIAIHTTNTPWTLCTLWEDVDHEVRVAKVEEHKQVAGVDTILLYESCPSISPICNHSFRFARVPLGNHHGPLSIAGCPVQICKGEVAIELLVGVDKSLRKLLHRPTSLSDHDNGGIADIVWKGVE